VLTAGVSALAFLTEADTRTAAGLEQAVDVDRALRLWQRDLEYGSDLVLVGADRVVIRYASGAAVVWEKTPDGGELHRVSGTTEASAVAAADALGLASRVRPTRTARGLVRDADYRASAVLQGVDAVSWWRVYDPTSTKTLGLKIEVRATRAGVQQHQRTIGLMLPRAPASKQRV
jgi:hypothetical protein